MKTLLFLNAGPYFWPHQKATTAKYELLSKHAGGFILSFVCSKEWRQVDIGNFQLRGFYISDAAYNIVPLRIIARILFTTVMSIYLHYFRKRIDVIIAYDPFMTGLLAYVISKLTGAKFVVEVNGVYDDPTNWELQKFNWLTYLKFKSIHKILPFILNRAHAVKLLYRAQVDGFKGIKHIDRYKCFHDFVALSEFRPGSSQSKYILFIGHPWHRKGVDILIRAFNEITPDFPEYKLKLVGILPEKKDFKYLYENNKQIELPGPVMPEKVPSLMAECSLFVLASRSEAMGRVLLEALASRKPIIASRVNGIPNYIIHEETGLLFDSEDVHGLAQAMRTIISDNAFANKLADNGYRYVQANLSEEAYVDQFMFMIDEAMAPHVHIPKGHPS